MCNDRSRTLFVTGFGKDIPASLLTQSFERYGRITRCDIPPPKTPESQLYAFVEYDRYEDAASAYEGMHSAMVGTWKVSVQYARSGPQKNWRLSPDHGTHRDSRNQPQRNQHNYEQSSQGRYTPRPYRASSSHNGERINGQRIHRSRSPRTTITRRTSPAHQEHRHRPRPYSQNNHAPTRFGQQTRAPFMSYKTHNRNSPMDRQHPRSHFNRPSQDPPPRYQRASYVDSRQSSYRSSNADFRPPLYRSNYRAAPYGRGRNTNVRPSYYRDNEGGHRSNSNRQDSRNSYRDESGK